MDDLPPAPPAALVEDRPRAPLSISLLLLTGCALAAGSFTLGAAVFANKGTLATTAAPSRLETGSVRLALRGDWSLHGPLPDVVREVADSAGAQVELDPRLEGRIDLELEDKTWREALERAAAQGGVGVETLPDGGLLVTPDAATFELIPFSPPPPASATAPPPAATGAVTSAVDSALSWISLQRRRDGSWPGAAGEGQVGATALALDALLTCGHTHRYGRYRHVVAKGMRWLKQHDPLSGEGELAPELSLALRARTLANDYFVTKDPFLLPHAKAAARALTALQRPSGGWGLRPGGAGCSLTTVFAVQALATLQSQGAVGAGPQLARASAFLARLTDPAGRTGLRRARDGMSLTLRGHRAPRVPLLSAGVPMAQLYCGGSPRDHPIANGIELIRRWPATPREPAWTRLAMLSLIGAGDRKGENLAWARAARARLLAAQVATGADAGSWPAAGLWGSLYGRVGASATLSATLQRLEYLR